MHGDGEMGVRAYMEVRSRAKPPATPVEADDVFVSETLLFDAPVNVIVFNQISTLMIHILCFNIAQLRAFKDTHTQFV